MTHKISRTFFATIITSAFVASATIASAGSITGSANFDGDVPGRRQIKMAADPACEAANPGGRTGEVMIVSADKKLANVFVAITSGLGDAVAEAPAEAAHINQQGCMYSPHVLGVMVGQTIEIKNSDGTLHNVHSLPKNSTQFNSAMPIKDQVIKKKFSSPERMVRMKCDVHPWMSAYVGVMEHPYFAVSAEDGTFTIANVPDGTYEVEAWHEHLGTKTGSVTVAGGDATLDFSFAPASK
jgi:plastocyanin